MTKNLTDGLHLFSGIDSAYINTGYDEADVTEGYIITIDNSNYAIYIDPDDGYRSYGVFAPTDKKPLYTFPPQEVLVKTIKQDFSGNDFEPSIEGVEIFNPKTNKLILSIKTTWWDSYYPCGSFEYNPQNLPINAKKYEKDKV